MTKDEAMKMALESLGTVREWEVADYDPLKNAITALHQALEQPSQDLIVGYADSHDLTRDGHDFWVSRQPGKNTVPLYLYGHPPKIWQGLTDEEIAEGAKQSWVDKQAFESAVWWAEGKLREKNGF